MILPFGSQRPLSMRLWPKGPTIFLSRSLGWQFLHSTPPFGMAVGKSLSASALLANESTPIVVVSVSAAALRMVIVLRCSAHSTPGARLHEALCQRRLHVVRRPHERRAVPLVL